MRRHPLIARISAASGAVLALAALMLLWQFRPGLPHINSPGAPFTSELAEQGLILVIWLLALYIAFSVFVHAAHAVIHPPRRVTILPGVIPNPPPPRPRASAPRTARPKFALTLAARPDPSSADTQIGPTAQAAAPSEAQTAAATLPVAEQRPELSISLLGPLRIDGTCQPPKRVPTRELIAYLALHPHGASRDELIEALWPAQDPKKTRRRLWDLATDARAALGDALIHEGERYRLDRAKVRIDLDQLDQLLTSTDADNEPDLEAALALWRGEPLQGADYIWAEAHIHRLRATLLGLLERAGYARLERNDARGALHMAEQAIALDQFHEASWRLALQAEHALGMRESITRRYDELTNALDEQLGLQPTRETRVMYRQLLGQS
jgi:DNA-binding SARP family transcriptional activator